MTGLSALAAGRDTGGALAVLGSAVVDTVVLSAGASVGADADSDSVCVSGGTVVSACFCIARFCVTAKPVHSAESITTNSSAKTPFAFTDFFIFAILIIPFFGALHLLVCADFSYMPILEFLPHSVNRKPRFCG